MNYLKKAKDSIEHFSLNESEYNPLGNCPSFVLYNEGQDNQVLVKEENYEACFQINFNGYSGCKIYLGHAIKGDISVNFNGNNSILYIGDNCDLKQLQLRSRQDNDFIAIGEEVSVAGNNVWVSGYGAGESNPAIIIGDDCMFSFDIVIRNSDAHPLFDAESDLQVNQPQSLIVLEPHVWVGERASILKDTTVGACSIIALGSTVTKDVPRFSTVKGTPGTVEPQKNTYWSRDHSDFAIKQAKHYSEKYSAS